MSQSAASDAPVASWAADAHETKIDMPRSGGVTDCPGGRQESVTTIVYMASASNEPESVSNHAAHATGKPHRNRVRADAKRLRPSGMCRNDARTLCGNGADLLQERERIEVCPAVS